MKDFSELIDLAGRAVARESGALEVLVDALIERRILSADRAGTDDAAGQRMWLNVQARKWATGCPIVMHRPELIRRAANHARLGQKTLVVFESRADAWKLGYLKESDARIPRELQPFWVDEVQKMCQSGEDELLRESAIFTYPEVAASLGLLDIHGFGGHPPIVVVG